MDATALCDLKRNHRQEARKAFEASIEKSSRGGCGSATSEPEGQRFLEDKIAPYHGLLRLLLEDGSSEAALAVAEKAKARQLLDALRSGKAQVTAAMTAEERLEEQRLTASASDLSRRLVDTRDPAIQGPIRASWEEAANGLQAFQTKLYAAHPELAAKRGDANPITLAETAELLPDQRCRADRIHRLRRQHLRFHHHAGNGRPAGAHDANAALESCGPDSRSG